MSRKKSYSGWWIVLAIATFAIPFAVFLFASGYVTGEEFSPNDFTRRSFKYNKMPLFGYVIRGIEYDDRTPGFEQTLFADGFLGKTTGSKKWDLISDNVSDQKSADFDAKFLTRYLELKDESNVSIWFNWNEKHPKLAVEFWPIVANLAREGLYLDASDLLLKAKSLDLSGVNKFTQEIKQESIIALQKKADRAVQEQLHEETVRIYSRIIDIEASKQRYLARGKAYQNLGDMEKYQQDVQSAQRFE